MLFIWIIIKKNRQFISSLWTPIIWIVYDTVNNNEQNTIYILGSDSFLWDVLHVGRSLLCGVLKVNLIVIPSAHSSFLAYQPVGVEPTLAFHLNKATVLSVEPLIEVDKTYTQDW